MTPVWRWLRPDGTKSDWQQGMGPHGSEHDDALLNGYGWEISFVGPIEFEDDE